jgi:arabinose-5-phosphate isomerase
LLIVDNNDKLVGIFSDGDFRRCVMRDDFSFDEAIEKYITKEPKVFDDTNILAIDALKIIEKYNIQVLVFVNKTNKINGLIHIHTLVKAGL